MLAVPSASLAKEPPNPNDPCSSAGRDTCHTTGVGFYGQSKYGIRWFGDYRGAVPGTLQTFCIDLGFWYPSVSYRFKEQPAGVLRNRQNRAVPLVNQQRMAYAIWAFGRTNDPKRQAAVMLYVHSLMGDARPGEIDPGSIDQALVPLFGQVADAAGRLHGPYRVEGQLPSTLPAGKPATATIRVLAAGGAPLAGVDLFLSAQGATVGGTATTNDAGAATVTLTPNGSGDVSLTVRTQALASTLPRVFAPSTPLAARNGQRLVAPSSQVVTRTLSANVEKTRVGISSSAQPPKLLVGEQSRDRVTVSGPLQDTIEVRAFGPFPTEGAIRCDGQPVWTGSLGVTGPGVYTTPSTTFAQPGWYVYQEVLPETSTHIGATTPCTDPAERVRVEVQPRVHTIVSSDRVEPGSTISDRVFVEGLVDQPATVQAFLYGPFPAREAVSCDGPSLWTGTISVTKDGEYSTQPYTPASPGFYVYRESIAPQGFVRGAQSDCADQAETTVVVAKPTVKTKISDQSTAPGSVITDSVLVTGLGSLTVPVRVDLFGPYATRGAIDCAGTPAWSGSFLAKGDGTYTTQSVKIEKAGYYTYRESIAQGPANDAATGPCAAVSETTLTRTHPHVTTIASAEVVVPGARISDRIMVSGLGSTAAAIDVQLFGPFSTRAAASCDGKPFWTGRVYAQGDGELRSPAVQVQKVGFYTFRESVVGSPLVPASSTRCPSDIETSLVRPEIITGRNDVTRYLRGRDAGALTPKRVSVQALGIDAPVFPARIDIPHGILGVSSNIHQTGWWADGVAPGATTGSILIAGHVDSRLGGAGAFFKLKEAKPGTRVQVTTSGGRTFAYRVVSVKAYLKAKLPADVYSRRGRARLVLVTCGGPFDEQTRHYRDNIVVTAVPTR